MRALLCAWLVIGAACAEESFWVGPTEVFLEPGAEDMVPVDLVEVLSGTSRWLSVRYSERVAIAILTKPLRLFPVYSTPQPGLGRGYNTGAFTWLQIEVRILGPSILDSAMLHEYIDHWACYLLTRDINSDHSSDECAMICSDLVASLRMVD